MFLISTHGIFLHLNQVLVVQDIVISRRRLIADCLLGVFQRNIRRVQTITGCFNAAAQRKVVERNGRRSTVGKVPIIVSTTNFILILPCKAHIVTTVSRRRQRQRNARLTAVLGQIPLGRIHISQSALNAAVIFQCHLYGIFQIQLYSIGRRNRARRKAHQAA